MSSSAGLYDVNATSPQKRLCFEKYRLLTFASLDNLQVSADRLAQSGFYYDSSQDDIICFSCGIRKRLWSSSENKIALCHLFMSEECLHANCRDERNVPISDYPNTASARSVPSEVPDFQDEHGNAFPSNKHYDTREMSEAPKSSSPHFTKLIKKPEVRSWSPQEMGSEVSLVTEAPVGLEGRETSIDRGKTISIYISNPQPEPNTQDNGSTEVSDQHCLTNYAPEYGPQQARETCETSIQKSNARTPGDSTPEHSDDDLSSLTMNGTASPAHVALTARVLSFSVWMGTDAPDPQSMARAGFYYMGTGDSVRCFYCGCTFYNVNRNENPLEMHERCHISCNYAKSVKEHNFTPQSPIRQTEERVVSPKLDDMTVSSLSQLRDGERKETSMVYERNSNTSHSNPELETNTQHNSSAEVSDQQRFTEHVLNSHPGREACETSQHQSNAQTPCNNTPEHSDDDLSSLTMSGTASPAHVALTARVVSFSGWMGTDAPDPQSLARAGFYYTGTGDSVRCFYCGFTFSNLRKKDDPWKVHERCQISCSYAATVRKDHFTQQTPTRLAEDRIDVPEKNVTEVRASSPSNDGCKPLTTPSKTKKSPEAKTVPGAERDRSIYVEDTQGTPNKSKSKTSSLIENKRTDKQSKNPGDHCKSNTDPELIEDEKNDGMSYFREMQSANLRLRQRIICRLCQAKPIDTIFLPCGHLCTCQQCAAAIQHCCLCNKRIRATAHVHIE